MVTSPYSSDSEDEANRTQNGKKCKIWFQIIQTR